MAIISIVVPVYNVEKYIDNCIESILNQTYDDYELILVDDGSKDSCPQICDSYAKQDKRIKVIHKENAGLSDARNAGTALAKGKYITYIDSDDYINPLYLEMLLKAITETGAEFSIAGIKNVYSLDSSENIKISDVKIRKLSSHQALSLILYQKYHDVSASGILMPLNMAIKHKFPMGKLFEDLFTTYKYYLDASNVAVIDAELYYYLQRSNSILDSKIDSKFVNDLLEASDNIVHSCEKYPDLIKAAENKKFSNYCSLVRKKLSVASNCSKTKIREYLDKYKKEMLIDNNARMKNRIAALIMMVFGVKGFVKVCMLVNGCLSLIYKRI